MATKCLNKGILVQASGFRDNACNISIVLAPSSAFNHVPYIRIFLGFYKKIFFIFSNTGTLEHWNKLLILLHKLKKNTQNIQNISISTLLEHTLLKNIDVSMVFYVLKTQFRGGFVKF